MKQRNMIYWNGYDHIFQWMHMNEPSKSQIWILSIILYVAATLLFLAKQKTGASFVVAWNYYYIGYLLFSFQLIIFIQNFNSKIQEM